MKRKKLSLMIAMVFVFATVLQLSSMSAMAVGTITSNLGAPYVTYTEDSPGSGRFLATINLKPAGYTPCTKATFFFTYNSNPTGWLVNIGDSITNDGWGGDSGTQSNDAELEIKDGLLGVHYNDDGTARYGTNIIRTKTGAAPANGIVRVEVSNNKVTYLNCITGESETVESPYGFALENQEDSEGEKDYLIYLGVNRVISGSYRNGSGVIATNIILN